MRARAQTRNPDVLPCCWIPGSREGARPGMTVLARAVDNDGAELVALFKMSLGCFGQRELRGDVVKARTGGKPF